MSANVWINHTSDWKIVKPWHPYKPHAGQHTLIMCMDECDLMPYLGLEIEALGVPSGTVDGQPAARQGGLAEPARLGAVLPRRKIAPLPRFAKDSSGSLGTDKATVASAPMKKTASGTKVKQEGERAKARSRSASSSSIEFVDDYVPGARKRRREESREAGVRRAPFAPANGKRIKTEGREEGKMPQVEVK